MKRDGRVEILRCLFMFGICLLHVIGYSGMRSGTLCSCLMWCVPGFVFISGYFGCKFEWKKLLRIYGVAAWCCPVSMIIVWAVGWIAPSRILWEAWGAFRDNWFIHAYVVLLLASPLIDAALTPDSDCGNLRLIVRRALPLLALVFVWSYLASYNATKLIIPRSTGLHPYSGLTLVGIYTAARIFRLSDIESKISTSVAVAAFLLSLGLCAFRLGLYNSPFALVTAASAFVLCRRAALPKWAERVGLMLAPSMFSVFLLHANGIFFSHVEILVSKVGFALMLAVIVFVLGIVADVPRRMIVHILKKRL